MTTSPITYRYGTTWLITPATAPTRFDTARRSGADIALLDLEDSVPNDGKDTARGAALRLLAAVPEPGRDEGPLLGLRLNALSTVDGLRDLVAVAECARAPGVLLLPKVESARDIEVVVAVTDGQNHADNILPGHRRTEVWALIETPRAIERLPRILRADRLAGVVFGAADYAAAVGCSRDRRALRYPRSVLAASAAAAGVPAIDSPFFDLHDPDGLRREAEEARALGFTGKGAVHPAQLRVIREAFTPSAQELGAAAAMVAAADTAGGGITTVDGRMVGPPLIAAARCMTNRAGDQPADHEPSEESTP